MTSKLKKLMAFLKKNGFNSVNATDATMEELKAAFGELHKLEEAKQSAASNFSSWPPEMPERHHKWRQSDEIQAARLNAPEPYDSPIRTLYISDVTLKKKFFSTSDGSRFAAWTADGKTPVFPIPL